MDCALPNPLHYAVDSILRVMPICLGYVFGLSLYLSFDLLPVVLNLRCMTDEGTTGSLWMGISFILHEGPGVLTIKYHDPVA